MVERFEYTVESLQIVDCIKKKAQSCSGSSKAVRRREDERNTTFFIKAKGVKLIDSLIFAHI